MLEEQRLRIGSRARRLRRTEALRKMLQETRLHRDMFVAPVFVAERGDGVEEIEGMPGVNRYTIEHLPKHLERLTSVGIRSLLLFGVPANKDEGGTRAYARDGVVPRALRAVKPSFPELVLMADVC